MKVIFLEDVAGTADAGEVKEVKNGFARNYLLPRGLAAPATADQLQRSRSIQVAAEGKRLKHSQEWTEVAKLIDGTEVAVEVRVGPNGRLFGSVTGRGIADKLSEAIGREIDHRQVLLGSAIHEPGDYPVTIRLYRDVTAEIKVSVVPEGYEPGEGAEAAVQTDAEAEVSISEGSEEGVADSDGLPEETTLEETDAAAEDAEQEDK